MAKAPKDVVDPAFGRRVKAGMQRAGQSVKDVVEALRVNRETVRLWRAGHVPKEENLKLLAALIGIDAAELRYDGKGPTTLSQMEPGRVYDEDERSLLETYRQLPAYGKRAVRARAVQLLEQFGPPTASNPNGKGFRPQ